MNAVKPESDGRRRYGKWAGNPAGEAEDETRCIEQVADNSTRFTRYRQCGKKRGHGPDGLYCKVHVPDNVRARLEEKSKHDEEAWELRRFEFNGAAFARALKLIMDGHNDPRAVAREALDGFRLDLIVKK